MRPEIESYLRDNGARYTTKALRRQLITAGHDPAEIDAALATTEEARGPQLAATRALRSRFWGWAFLINFVVLVGVTALVSSFNSYAGAAFMVLGIAMLIGLAIFGSIGRALLDRSGLVVALVVPVVAALLLGGWCLALMRGSMGAI
jgi:lipopolysaccharide export LptBFGC system permease protein LptF